MTEGNQSADTVIVDTEVESRDGPSIEDLRERDMSRDATTSAAEDSDSESAATSDSETVDEQNSEKDESDAQSESKESMTEDTRESNHGEADAQAADETADSNQGVSAAAVGRELRKLAAFGVATALIAAILLPSIPVNESQIGMVWPIVVGLMGYAGIEELSSVASSARSFGK